MELLWGIDLGGTKTEGVVIEYDGASGFGVRCRLRIPTEAHRGYDHIVGQILSLVADMEAATGLHPSHIGIGTPGTLDPLSGTMKNCNTTALNGRPLLRDLESRSGIRFRMANDANCFAVAEARFGAVPKALPDATVVFGVIMGTGVGGGVVVNGKVINGRQGICGEWGHNFLDASGGPCYCGRTGCVETILSGPALERYYLSRTGRALRLPDICRLHEEGSDPAATETLHRLTHFFGKAIAAVINILDPDAIVLGGGVGNIGLLYTEGVAETARHVFNNRLDTCFLRPELGDSAGVFGAALL